jgi:hypothetical protein
MQLLNELVVVTVVVFVFVFKKPAMIGNLHMQQGMRNHVFLKIPICV